MRGSAPILNRLIALVGLAALTLSLVHVHADAPESGHAHGADAIHDGPFHASDASDAPATSQAPRMAADDAHHEHSSRAAVDVERCFACRSQSEHEGDTRRVDALPAVPSGVGVVPNEGRLARRTPFAGLPPTRAPPTLLV